MSKYEPGKQMDKDYLLTLLHKYQQGTVTNEERKFLENYYNLFQNEPDILDKLTVEEKKKFGKEIAENIWNNIADVEKVLPAKKFIYKRLISTAAAAAIFIAFISSGLFFYFKKQSSGDVAVQQHNNKVNELTDNTSAIHLKKENRVIFLPDGSRVILSPGSRLNYPSTFDGMEKREVFLEGQAFFDVKHNVARPFIVHTGKVETTVLGTAFNVEAIHGDNKIIVTVTRGKVKVSDPHKILGIIMPQQQITYKTDKEESTLRTVSSNDYLDWKNQDLFIDNLTLSEAANILEDQFKVKIIIKDSSIREQRFTATFSKDDKLEQTLESISEFNGLTYTYNKEKSIVIIKIK